MVNNQKELISALVDDELRGSELDSTLSGLREDPDLLARWGRYHLISDTLHANLSAADTVRLHERVWQALEAEPTVLAPRRQTRLPPLAKQAAGIAIAASVAAVAILAVQRFEPPQAPAAAVQVAQTQRPPLAQLTTSGAPLAAPPDVKDRLNPYLLNHNEYSASAGMQGVLPYARIVSYENAQ